MARPRVEENGSKKRRGRPPGSRKSDAQKPLPAKEKTKQKRKSQAEEDDEDELSGLLVDQTQSSRPRKRKAHIEPDEMAEEGLKARKKYVQLEAKTKRIPQEQIDTWPNVSAQVLEQIVAVIRDAKKDIANTQRDERKVIAAHNTLNPLVKKLARQLAISRIPPQAKDIHFNIDKLTERNAQVSREVTTARHSKQLLSEQVRVAEHMLEKDEQILEQLKKDTKKWRTEWKHQEKHGRIHPLLLESEKTVILSDGPDDICLRPTPPLDTALLATPDAELAPVLEQLRRSLENMQGNHTHVDGIRGALRDTQAALDEILFRNASAQQYATL